MNVESSAFLDKISGISHVLADARKDTTEYWLPEDPPITIIFAEIGHAIVDKLEELDSDAQRALFLTIEDGISSEDEQLATAIATGLIEAIVGRAARRGNFAEFLVRFGEKSRSHAEAWYGT